MKNNLKIDLKQIKVSEDLNTNLEKLDQIKPCDVLVLPEMWNCPYHNDALKDAYLYHDQSLNKMINTAKKNHIWIIGGSISYKACDGKVYNRCYIIDDQGNINCTYDKTHLFTLNTRSTYTERSIFEPGNKLVTFMIGDIKAGIILCYDIRFPEMTRILAQAGIKILFCPAAFNESATNKHWELFLRTRALENEIYVCGVAPARYTYKSYASGGHSMIVDPFGEIIDQMDTDEDEHVIDISLDTINKARYRMPFWQIRRNDLYDLEEHNARNKD